MTTNDGDAAGGQILSGDAWEPELGHHDSCGDLVVLEALAEGVVVLRVRGALDLALSPMLRQITERAARQRPRLALIDLTEVTFLASVGMAELLRAQGLLRDHDADMRVVAADRVVLRPLMLTRLIDEFDIYPALDEALTDRR